MSIPLPVAQITHQRKTAKAFEPGCELTPEQSAAIRDLLRMSPSSTNAQPWHFFIAKTEAGKRRIESINGGVLEEFSPQVKVGGVFAAVWDS